MDTTKVGVIGIFVLMIAAVALQISVFLDPQNNLATGGVASVGLTLIYGSPVIVTLSGLIIATIVYAAFRVVKD